MSDMLKTITPKTNQLNFDHFVGGKSFTIKITEVKFTSGEQPVEFCFENSNGKVYRPCKSMRRVIVAAWGEKASSYIGRSMTLYGDPKVIYAGEDVGGVRISHMSDISDDIIVSLRMSQKNRKPYIVKPLVNNKMPPGAQETQREAHHAKEETPGVV